MKRNPPKPIYKQPWETIEIKPWSWKLCSACRQEFRRENGWRVSRRYFSRLLENGHIEENFGSSVEHIFYFCARCLKTEKAVNDYFAKNYEKMYIR
jgi:hypothetical protein